MGRKEEAVGPLKKAILLDEKYRELAKTDADFKSLQDFPAFKELIGKKPLKKK